MGAVTNLRILGGDGREYGPVAIEVVKRWIAEGRALASTLARANDQDSWRPLSAYAELAGDLAASGAPAEPPMAAAPPLVGASPIGTTPAGTVMPPGAVSPAGARKSKIIAGILGIVVGGFGVHRFYLGFIGPGLVLLAMTALSWLALPIGLFSRHFSDSKEGLA